MNATATLTESPWSTIGQRTSPHVAAMGQARHDSTHDLRAVPLGEYTDEQLMAAVGGGRSDALEALYDRHVRGAFGLAMKIVRDPGIAEEVVQDVFVKLWSQPATFSPERGKFGGWLLTLVHNRSVDKLRRAQSGLAGRTLPLDAEGENGLSLADVLPDTGPSPDDAAWLNAKGDIVREALGQLPELQRQAISMAYFGGLTQREIAERLQEPLGTIKTRTRSGLQHLRRVLVRQGTWGDLRG
ncbi:MAG TPA: sigma-70 family RNA polymerase sigma factor [Chloroflexia bacterium]|nr:sigma-70 family RNA polymerase sigma factor [Chloroflexia bacterium]